MFTLHTLGGTNVAINPDHVVRVIDVPADEPGGNPAGAVIYLTDRTKILTAVPFARVIDSVAKGRR